MREPVSTAAWGDQGLGHQAGELRTPTAEERARRKWRKNIILWAFGLLILGITLALLLLTGPGGMR